MAQTLDQKRAQYAWGCASKNAVVGGYREMAKGAPALIMGNGLMPALAFYQSRTGSNKKPAELLLEDILGWLGRVNGGYNDAASALPFGHAMQGMQGADSLTYMRLTDETLAMLKWLRQFADAVQGA